MVSSICSNRHLAIARGSRLRFGIGRSLRLTVTQMCVFGAINGDVEMSGAEQQHRLPEPPRTELRDSYSATEVGDVPHEDPRSRLTLLSRCHVRSEGPRGLLHAREALDLHREGAEGDQEHAHRHARLRHDRAMTKESDEIDGASPHPVDPQFHRESADTVPLRNHIHSLARQNLCDGLKSDLHSRHFPGQRVTR
jgi:hypothetical protein